MKNLLYLATIAFVISVELVGVCRAQDSLSQGIPQQLKAIQTQLTGIKTDVSQIQTTVNTISTWPRKYFITATEYQPTIISVAKACGPGFHFASLFEILEPSGLLYDTKNPLAFYQPSNYDQGSGPPTFRAGWIRTGFVRFADTDAPGQSNCNSWTTNNVEAFGTAVTLSGAWNNLYAQEDAIPIAPWWIAIAYQCNQQLPVWCVSD
jgi:hypothetical protein